MRKTGALLFRCDANAQIGTGHVMRCLALAQAWQDAGGLAIFSMADVTSALENRLGTELCEVKHLKIIPGSKSDADSTAESALQTKARWVVVDGYHFSEKYSALLHDRGCKIVLLDDDGRASRYSGDIVLNQNTFAHADLYKGVKSGGHVLLGARYCLLRREFLNWKKSGRDFQAPATKVLITMGGSDPDNVTSRILEAVGSLGRRLELTVVVGGSNSHVAEVENAVRKWVPSATFLFNPTNMPALMADADVAIAGAGTTSWEMCFLGLPSLLYVLAENQQPVAADLHLRRVAWNLGRSEDFSPRELTDALFELLNASDARHHMSERGQALVDGFGAARVVAHLQGEVKIRNTKPEDCAAFWRLANDRSVRDASFSTESIPWDDHERWFREKLQDRDATLYTAVTSDEVPVGQIRFQKTGKGATVSIAIDDRFRGRGWGRLVLFLACEQFFAESEVASLDAYIKPWNEASHRLFRDAGFHLGGTELVQGQAASHFVYEK